MNLSQYSGLVKYQEPNLEINIYTTVQSLSNRDKKNKKRHT